MGGTFQGPLLKTSSYFLKNFSIGQPATYRLQVETIFEGNKHIFFNSSSLFLDVSLSSSTQAIAFGTSSGYVHVWSSRQQPVFNLISQDTEWPQMDTSYPSIPMTDETTPFRLGLKIRYSNQILKFTLSICTLDLFRDVSQLTLKFIYSHLNLSQHYSQSVHDQTK